MYPKCSLKTYMYMILLLNFSEIKLLNITNSQLLIIIIEQHNN